VIWENPHYTESGATGSATADSAEDTTDTATAGSAL